MPHNTFTRPRLHLAAAIGAAGLVASVLAGCSQSSSATQPITSDHPTGTVVFWNRSTLSPWIKQVAADFNKTHKGLQVQVTNVNDAQLPSKLSTVLRTNEVPDLVTTDDVDGLPYIDSGNFLDITKQVKASDAYSTLSKPQLDLATIDGKIYGTPAVLDASVLLYNKTLFAKAGIEEPPSSLEQALEDARKITALGGGVTGWNFAGNCSGCLTFTVMPSVYAADSDVISGTDLHAQTANVAGNTKLQAVLRFYQELWKDGLTPKSVRSDNGSLWNKNFQNGNIGMTTGGIGTYSNATAAQQENIGVAPIPGPDGGISTYIGGANFGIPKKAKNAAGAWEFMQYAISKQAQELAPKYGFAPIRTDLVDNAAFRQQYPAIVPGLTAAEHGSAPRTLYHNQLFSLESGPWQTMFTKAVFGDDISGAMQQGQSDFTAVLKGGA